MPDRYYDTSVYVYHWPNGIHQDPVITLHRDAAIRQLDAGFGRYGPAYQLRVAIDADPETGDILDCDGDRALDRFDLVGGATHIDDGQPTVRGFIPLDEWNTKFMVGEWHQVPYSNIARRDKEREKNAESGRHLPDEDKRDLVAIRQYLLSYREKGKKSAVYDPVYNGWIVIPYGTDGAHPEVDITLARAKDLAERDFLFVSGNDRENGVGYHMTTQAEDIADALIQEGDDAIGG